MELQSYYYIKILCFRPYENTLPRSRKKEEDINRKSETHKVLSRRWSSITQSSTKKKKRNSLNEASSKEFIEWRSEKSKNLNDHLKVSEKEYEEIKNRVCKIEKELSRELENAQPKSLCGNMNIGFDNTINNIQSAYEQTLVQTEPLSPTTDHLARRLSRELRIRTSEQKIIRSPSARKIGNMKRRSRELERPNNKIFKSSSFQYTDMKNNAGINCLSSDDIQFRDEDVKPVNGHVQYYGSPKLMNISYKLSSHLSVNSLDQAKINGYVNSKISNGTSPFKFTGKNTDFFESINATCKNKSVSTENVSSNTVFSSNRLDRNSVGPYLKDSYKVKVSKSKDKSIKPTVSSIKRSINLKQKRKSEKVYVHTKRLSINSKENLMSFTDEMDSYPKDGKYLDKCVPTNLPYIKKSLIVKSPKRFCGTPVKNTPLKVLTASQRLNANNISF